MQIPHDAEMQAKQCAMRVAAHIQSELNQMPTQFAQVLYCQAFALVALDHYRMVAGDAGARALLGQLEKVFDHPIGGIGFFQGPALN